MSSRKEWEDAYYSAFEACILRYRAMAADRGCEDLLKFLEEFNRDVPLMKMSRWMGYVQCALIERGITTVQAERDWTRPFFRPLDFA
jgi:hypothetical protein